MYGWYIITGSIAVLSILIIVGVIVTILLYEKNRFKKEINDDLKKVIEQINNTQAYEHSSEKEEAIVLERVKNDIKRSIVQQEQDAARLWDRHTGLENRVDELSLHMSQWRGDMSKQLETLKK